MQLEIASLLVTGPRVAGRYCLPPPPRLTTHYPSLSLSLQTTEPLVVKWTPTLPLLELELESGEK